MSLDAYMAAFGDQEGLCEAGVFGLGKRGWRIVSRHRFTQQGTALQWCQDEVAKVKAEQRKKWKRMRTSVVAADGPETLEAVCAQYEELRKSGDPSFIPLEE